MIVIENSWLERFFSLPTARSPRPFSFVKLFVRFPVRSCNNYSFVSQWLAVVAEFSSYQQCVISKRFTDNVVYVFLNTRTLSRQVKEPLTDVIRISRGKSAGWKIERRFPSLAVRFSVSLTLSYVLCRVAGTWREIVGQDAWWYDYLSGLGSQNEKTGGVARLQTRDSTMHTRVCRCRCQIASVAGSTRRTCEKLPQSTQPVPQVPV